MEVRSAGTGAVLVGLDIPDLVLEGIAPEGGTPELGEPAYANSICSRCDATEADAARILDAVAEADPNAAWRLVARLTGAEAPPAEQDALAT